MPLKWPAAQGGVRVAHECVEQKRQRHDHQWIELESPDDVAMKQTVQAARAAATRTSKSCKRAKGAGRKKPDLPGSKMNK